MVIYELEICVYTNSCEKLQEDDCYFSDVFPALDLAVQRGKQEVKERIEKLFIKNTDYDERALEDFVRKNVQYTFVVREFDPALRNDGCLREDIKNITLENSVEFSSQIAWNYDYKGELVERWEWRGCNFNILPSDYQVDAGTKFTKGDLVALKEFGDRRERDNPSGVYVVGGVPGRRIDAKNPLYWENIYCIRYLHNIDDEYSGVCHEHVHESELEVFQGELPADSVLFVLSKIFKDDSNVSKEAMERLHSKKIIFAGNIHRPCIFMGGMQSWENGDLSTKVDME